MSVKSRIKILNSTIQLQLVFFILILPVTLWSQGQKWTAIPEFKKVSIKKIGIIEDGTIFFMRDCLHYDLEATEQVPVLFRSTDGGKRWEDITSNIPKHENIKTHKRLFGLFVQKNVVYIKMYVGIFPNHKMYVIYRSTDLGSTWKEITGQFGFIGNPTLVTGNDGNLYIQIRGVWKSTDNGDTWAEIPELRKYGFIGGMFVNEDGSILGKLGRSINDRTLIEKRVRFSPDYEVQIVKIDNSNHFKGEVSRFIREDPNSYIFIFNIRNGLIKDQLFATVWYELEINSPHPQNGLYESNDGGISWKCIDPGVGSTQFINEENIIVGSSKIRTKFTSFGVWTKGHFNRHSLWEVDSLNRRSKIYDFIRHPNGSFFLGSGNGVYVSQQLPKIDECLQKGVPFISQPTDWSCWATVSTMMYMWKEGKGEGTTTDIERVLEKISPARLKKYLANLKDPTSRSGGLRLYEEDEFFIEELGLTWYTPCHESWPFSLYWCTKPVPSALELKELICEEGPIALQYPTSSFSSHIIVIDDVIEDSADPGYYFLSIADPLKNKKVRISFNEFRNRYLNLSALYGEYTKFNIYHW